MQYSIKKPIRYKNLNRKRLTHQARSTSSLALSGPSFSRCIKFFTKFIQIWPALWTPKIVRTNFLTTPGSLQVPTQTTSTAQSCATFVPSTITFTTQCMSEPFFSLFQKFSVNNSLPDSSLLSNSLPKNFCFSQIKLYSFILSKAFFAVIFARFQIISA